MKELSIKEKAEAYDEAIKKLRDFYRDYDTFSLFIDVKEELANMFPELAESEDERIRKEILTAFSCGHDNSDIYGHGITYGQVRAWLEKQGTPAKLSEEEQNRFAKGVLTSCASSFIDYLDAHKYEGKMCVSNGECEDIENAFHNAMWDKLYRYYGKYIEKQGETKHFDYENANIQQKDFAPKVEPKFKVGDKVESIIDGFECTIESIDNTCYYGDTTNFDIQDQDGWKLVEPKPWSEEDERLYECLIEDQEEALDKVNNEKSGHSEIISDLVEMYRERIAWFKDLKDRVQPQPKQEWSEEDNQYLYGLIELIEQSKAEIPITLKGKAADNCIEWLKSLRPRILGSRVTSRCKY